MTHFPVRAVAAATQASLFPLGWKNRSGMGKGEEWEEGATEDELRESVSTLGGSGGRKPGICTDRVFLIRRNQRVTAGYS